MRCATARKEIAGLEASRRPGSELARHLAGCAECRRVYERLRRLEAVVRSSGGVAYESGAEAEAAFTVRVMAAVHEAHAETDVAALRVGHSETEPSSPTVSLRGWTAGGAAIIASLVLIQFSDVVDWLRGSLGPVIDVALATMLGLALTIYLLILVGSNLKAVRRALRWLTG